MCQRALTERRKSTPQRGDDAPLECIAECRDAFCGECTLASQSSVLLTFLIVEAAELVVIQPVKVWGWG